MIAKILPHNVNDSLLKKKQTNKQTKKQKNPNHLELFFLNP